VAAPENNTVYVGLALQYGESASPWCGSRGQSPLKCDSILALEHTFCESVSPPEIFFCLRSWMKQVYSTDHEMKQYKNKSDYARLKLFCLMFSRLSWTIFTLRVSKISRQPVRQHNTVKLNIWRATLRGPPYSLFSCLYWKRLCFTLVCVCVLQIGWYNVYKC